MTLNPPTYRRSKTAILPFQMHSALSKALAYQTSLTPSLSQKKRASKRVLGTLWSKGVHQWDLVIKRGKYRFKTGHDYTPKVPLQQWRYRQRKPLITLSLSTKSCWNSRLAREQVVNSATSVTHAHLFWSRCHSSVSDLPVDCSFCETSPSQLRNRGR